MEEIEITLPVSGKNVTLRNYTTVADDERAEQVLYAGVTADQSDDGQKISFPVANIMASQKSYIPRLVKSLDGDTNNIAIRLKDLPSEDGVAIEEAVTKIVEEHSPKAKGAEKASKKDTTKS